MLRGNLAPSQALMGRVGKLQLLRGSESLFLLQVLTRIVMILLWRKSRTWPNTLNFTVMHYKYPKYRGNEWKQMGTLRGDGSNWLRWGVLLIKYD